MTQTLCNSTSTSVQWVVFETVIDMMYRQDEAIGLQGMSFAEGGGSATIDSTGYFKRHARTGHN